MLLSILRTMRKAFLLYHEANLLEPWANMVHFGRMADIKYLYPIEIYGK